MREPFENLKNSDAFEELCFDLLEAEGFRNLLWRGPSADGGRDIEAEWVVTDPIGGLFTTKWYIECKWYSESVPFSEIEPKLLAASTCRVDYLLLITSSMVRNTALTSISEWLSHRGNIPRFRYWTGRDVLHRIVRHENIFKKHFPNLDIPSWSDRISQLNKLEIISRSGLDRQIWRLLPSLQWCRSTIKADINEEISFSVKDELDLIMATLRLSQYFEYDQNYIPAKSVISISNCLKQSLRIARNKYPNLTSRIEIDDDINGNSSYPILMACFFELIHNCLCYSEDSSFTLFLKKNGLAWKFELLNPSKDNLPSVWPAVGLRGQEAKLRNISGQGVGCWLTSEAVTSLGLTIDWKVDNDNWVVSLKGGIEK